MEPPGPSLSELALLLRLQFDRAVVVPLASAESATFSQASVMPQVSGDNNSSSLSHGAQPSPWATTRAPPARDRNISDRAHVVEENEFFFLRSGRLVALPQAQGIRDPVNSPFVSARAAPLSRPVELQTMLQTQHAMPTQGHLEPRIQPLARPASFVNQGSRPLANHEVLFTHGPIARPQVHGASPPGLNRGSVPLVQRQVSGTSTSGGFEGCQGYNNLRQGAKRVPHPKDSRLSQGGRYPMTLRACISDHGQRMQNFAAHSHDGHHVSVGNAGNYPENALPPVSRYTPATLQVNPGGYSANHQQDGQFAANLGQIKQRQNLDTYLPVFGSNYGSAFYQGNVALESGDNRTSSEQGVDDITPRRRIADISVSMSAPARLAAQATPMWSGEGHSMSRFNGSPIGGNRWPLIIDPVRGPPPQCFPRLQPAMVSIPQTPSVFPQILSRMHQSEYGHGRATSANFRSEVAHRPQGEHKITFNHLATPQQQQTVGTRFVEIPVPTLQEGPPLIASSTMPPSQITPLALVPYQPVSSLSRHLSIIAPGGKKPSMEVACDPQNFPFMELAHRAQPANDYGVIRISNIPYSTTRSEVIAFLGRNADLIEDRLEPIHIVMDRVTGKTLDAFVEFKNVFEAVKAVDRQNDIHRDGRTGGRLGNRFVTLEVCGLETMMRALFPKTQNVVWHGSVPEIIPVSASDRYTTGFKGFVTREELVLLSKHVQDPNRIQFSQKCPQRPFECMISTIAKYPWYMPDYITIDDRDEMFRVSLAILKGLMCRMSEDDLLLNSRLYKRMVRIILSCPGFTESQKDDIAFTCDIELHTINPPLAPMADHWYILRTIGPKPGVELDVLQYYIALIREATTSMDVVTLAQRGSMSQPGPPPYFGNINIQYPPDLKSWTLSQVARIEWDVIEGLLRLSLSRD